MTDDRLIAMEEKLAHQEHAVQELNDVVTAQHRRIDALERRCAELMQRLTRLAEHLEPEPPGDETPPHY